MCKDRQFGAKRVNASPLQCSYTSLNLWQTLQHTYVPTNTLHTGPFKNRQTIYNSNNNRQHSKDFFSPTILSIVSVPLRETPFLSLSVSVSFLHVHFYSVFRSFFFFLFVPCYSTFAEHSKKKDRQSESVRLCSCICLGAHIANVQLHECKCAIFHFYLTLRRRICFCSFFLFVWDEMRWFCTRFLRQITSTQSAHSKKDNTMGESHLRQNTLQNKWRKKYFFWRIMALVRLMPSQLQNNSRAERVFRIFAESFSPILWNKNPSTRKTVIGSDTTPTKRHIEYGLWKHINSKVINFTYLLSSFHQFWNV